MPDDVHSDRLFVELNSVFRADSPLLVVVSVRAGGELVIHIVFSHEFLDLRHESLDDDSWIIHIHEYVRVGCTRAVLPLKRLFQESES